eukprot:SAG31_NODE_6143_length_2150_cov_17.266212_1_plen_79_part_00
MPPPPPPVAIALLALLAAAVGGRAAIVVTDYAGLDDAGPPKRARAAVAIAEKVRFPSSFAFFERNAARPLAPERHRTR